MGDIYETAGGGRVQIVGKTIVEDQIQYVAFPCDTANNLQNLSNPRIYTTDGQCLSVGLKIGPKDPYHIEIPKLFDKTRINLIEDRGEES